MSIPCLLFQFLFLVEETSSRISESVDVPKVLSDAFKAVIAAIFVDSSGDLKTVWNVCYNMMKHEIGNSFVFENATNSVSGN